MRLLFVTQGETLRVFDALRNELSKRMKVERCGFIISDSWTYQSWLQENPDFEHQGHLLLKEWEVTASPHGKPDLDKLARYEREIGGEPGLFGALVADRRLFMGPNCTFSQDYRRRFDDDSLLFILQQCVEANEKIFEELKPQVVVSFICVTIFDYLSYLFARAKGIPVLNLRPTRVGDRVSFSTILNDPSPELVRAYQAILETGKSPHLEEAESYLRRVREQHGRYEGVVSPSDKPALIINRARRSLFAVTRQVLKNVFRYYKSVSAADNHVPNPIKVLLFHSLVNPLRARVTRKYLSSHYLTPQDTLSLRYAFYPLHTEPEVSLLVYGRPYVNQIEVIRAVAMSLPTDMVLLVKEHPWMVGKRSLNYYKKLLAIPRVRIASPRMEARALILDAKLVIVITGSVALEAAILGKPVITFGDCPYNLLPSTMVRRVKDPRSLGSVVRDMLENYRTDETALKAYLAGVMDSSVSLNLYSVLLKKAGVHFERTTNYMNEIAALSDYFQACLSANDMTKTSHRQTATW